MFVILLKFSDNKEHAGMFMEGHNQWITHGFEDDVFLMAGSLPPNLGGSIMAHNTSRAELENRLKNDPFITGNVVTSEILEIKPAKADDRLQFLLDG